MKILFSAIAWNSTQKEDIASILNKYGFDGIEAAPGMFVQPLESLTPADIASERVFWCNASLPPLAMQGLLFGKPDLKLFGIEQERRELSDYLTLVIKVASNLGCGPLVFGSPRNRQKKNLAEQDAMEQAALFFKQLAPKAANAGCKICIEANAVGYNCDFITTHEAAANLVNMVNSPGFGLQVDTGVMRMNGESPTELAEILQKYELTPAHVHISQPYLACDYEHDNFHRQMSELLKDISYSGAVSVEMKNTGNLGDIEQAAKLVRVAYGSSN